MNYEIEKKPWTSPQITAIKIKKTENGGGYVEIIEEDIGWDIAGQEAEGSS